MSLCGASKMAHIHGRPGILTKNAEALDGKPYPDDLVILKDENNRSQTPDHVPAISQRFKAPGLLFLGALFAFFAFFGSFLCVVMKFTKQKYKASLVLGTNYTSGNGYWPETVSESVSDHDSAAGKIFFTCCLVAGISLLMSWYPFCLRNVYTGPAQVGCTGMYWTTFRQFCPTVGLFSLIGVSVYPSKIAAETNGGYLCLFIHLTGASMMFCGYMVCEFKCMEMFGFKLPTKIKKSFLDVVGMERRLRQGFVCVMFTAYCAFLVFEVLLMTTGVCCADEWMQQGQWYNRTSPAGFDTHHVLSEATVQNTSSGTYLLFKFGAYMGECVSGCCLIASHFVVWYYCEERRVAYCDAHLDMVHDQAGEYDYDKTGDYEEDDDDDEYS